MSSKPKKTKFSDLNVNRELLDSKFEGYKLSLEQLRTEFHRLETGVKTVLASNDQWSYQHVRQFANHNHLHVNPWTIKENRRSVYFVLDSGIYAVHLDRKTRSLPNAVKIVDLEFPSDYRSRSDKYNVSFTFPSAKSVFVADGCGNAILCSISFDDDQRENWNIVQRFDDFGGDGRRAFSLLDSRERNASNDGGFVDVLAVYVDEIEHRGKDSAEESKLFVSVLEWITLKKASTDGPYTIDRRRRLQTKGNLDYAALSLDCKAICCATSEPIRFVFDSEKPVDDVEIEESREGRMWPEVINGDQRGEYVADPDLVKEVSERLKQFTSDGENPSAVDSMVKTPFNVQQLEECDAVDSDASSLLWIDGETHAPAAEADTGGHQWLFNVRLNGDHPPYICLRHDVDGILWRVADGLTIDSEQPSYWSHEHTFNAFGYVQAGKPDRKFCTCATDGSYAVVVDCTRHAYIYWQPSTVDSDLRNRKTGQRVSRVAKQQLISIGPSDNANETVSLDMLGVVALDDILLLLTENRLIGVLLK